MKLSLRLTIALFFLMTAVFVTSSVWQSGLERSRIVTDLDRTSAILAGRFSLVAGPLYNDQSTAALNRLMNDFADAERIRGLAAYDLNGDLLAASRGVGRSLAVASPALQSVVLVSGRSGRGRGAMLELENQRVHVYSAPVRMGVEETGVLTVFHDTDFMHDRISRIWVINFFRFAVYTILVLLTTLAVFYLNVLAPAKRTADWIKRVRMGESPSRMPRDAGQVFEPLAREVTQMARSLTVAREAAEEEARLRQAAESLWTPERLKEFVRTKLGGRQIFAVSNREPYQHVRRGKEIVCVVPPSGLVTAIEPVLKACGGTWIAEGNGDADRETVDENDKLRVPPEEPSYTLRRVWLTREEEEGYYYGFSNEGLWPLCHIAHTRPTFRESDWHAYEAVNRKFADATLEELRLSDEPCVLVQDYHFALLPRLIKESRPDARVTIFWHIPWPNPESFGICPWQTELLRGMLAADIIGFHTQYHCNNFLQTVDRFLESRIDYEHFTVNREGHTTWVKPFPISIAFLGPDAKQGEPRVSREELLRAHGLEAQYLGVGVDRLDYTKGILERFRAVETFLERHPHYQGKFTFVELGAPSRTLIPKYQEFVAEVEREVERINARFKGKNWKAILLLKGQHSHKDIAPYYRAADVCMVTSLHDGMNLVAKEYVMERDDERGALVLSQFTGAARELRDALIVNPYDVSQTAESIRAALEMPASEQTERMRRMRDVLKDRNIYRWAADLVNELAQVRPNAPKVIL